MLLPSLTKKSWFGAFFFINICFNFLTPLAAATPEILQLQELPLSSQQMKELEPDLPIQALAVEPSEHIWFIGSHYLWCWTPNQQAMKQIKLPTSSLLRHLFIKGQKVFVSDDHNLFQIEIDPFKVLRFSTEEKDSSSLALLENHSSIYWIKTDGIYLFSPDVGLEKILEHSLAFTENAKYLFLSQTKTLLMTRGDNLVTIVYGRDKKPKKIHQLKKNIFDLQYNLDEVFAFTPDSLFRFSDKGSLIQTVPVKTDHQLILAAIQGKAHAFLFQDRLLEMYLPNEDKVLYYHLNFGRVQNATAISFNNAYLALILDGKPRTFQFPNTAWSS